MRVVAYKGQYRITIPKDIAEAKRWKPGTRIRFVELSDGSIVLRVIEELEKKGSERRKREWQ